MMISMLIDDTCIYLNMHIEQLYSAINNESSFNDVDKIDGYIKYDYITKMTIDRLASSINELNKDYFNYTIVLDMNHITSIQENFVCKFCALFQRWKKIDIVNSNLKYKNDEILSIQTINGSKTYLDVFKEESLDVVKKICENNTGYQTETGVILETYINVKRIVENNNQMFIWSYILAESIYINPNFKEIVSIEKPILFCHTLCGVSIAVIIAKLLGLDILYIDNLGHHNQIDSIHFHNSIKPKNYIVVVDMICQGNEILRAINMIEYMGGSVSGYLSFIKLDISNLRKFGIEENVIIVSASDAFEHLKYNIGTQLCDKCKSLCKGENT
ncbi:hypothetical protein [Lacrimispora sp.]|uniref:hypothetical protein n=1 Tax=Lacrimispora sp. TaxID=2719234 RepID=UPI002FDAF7F7